MTAAERATGATAEAAWWEPTVEAVAPDVHRIPLPLPLDGLRAVNVYVLADGDGLTLVDGGWAIAAAQARLEAALAALGHELGDVRRVLVTHVHRDHYTQAIAIRRAVGAHVAIGVGERANLAALVRHDVDLLAAQGERLRAHGAGALADELAALPFDRHGTLSFYEEPDAWLAAGERVPVGDRTLEVIPTPGHTRGHIVLRDAGHGLLLAGDHVLPHITPSIGFEIDRPTHPLGDYLASLRLLLALPDARLLPAHGPVGPSVHARVTDLLAHHAVRLAAAGAAIVAGAGTAADAAGRLRWTSRGRALAELTSFDRMLAVLETAAHLDVLVLQGELVRSEDGEGRVTYGVVAPTGG